MGIVRQTIRLFTAAVITLGLALFLGTLGVKTFNESIFSVGGLFYLTIIAWGWWVFGQPQ